MITDWLLRNDSSDMGAAAGCRRSSSCTANSLHLVAKIPDDQKWQFDTFYRRCSSLRKHLARIAKNASKKDAREYEYRQTRKSR